LNQFDRNLQKIDDIKRKGRLKSENKIKEEQKYYRDHNNYLKERVHLLSDIKESKIPFYEKLPKDSLFYKHHIASMASKSLKKEAGQKAIDDAHLLQEVNDRILKPVAEFGEIQRKAID
jgi:hypothetical protein